MGIDIVATESDITVKITADMKTFDVLSYRQRLSMMASDNQLAKMEWADLCVLCKTENYGQKGVDKKEFTPF